MVKMANDLHYSDASGSRKGSLNASKNESVRLFQRLVGQCQSESCPSRNESYRGFRYISYCATIRPTCPGVKVPYQ
jgi:hypothetical protein